LSKKGIPKSIGESSLSCFIGESSFGNKNTLSHDHYTIIIHYQGLVNVLIEHHPTIGDIITNKYLKVMFNIPKTGHLPTPNYPEVFP